MLRNDRETLSKLNGLSVLALPAVKQMSLGPFYYDLLLTLNPFLSRTQFGEYFPCLSFIVSTVNLIKISCNNATLK